jgi:hypothetical protein
MDFIQLYFDSQVNLIVYCLIMMAQNSQSPKTDDTATSTSLMAIRWIVFPWNSTDNVLSSNKMGLFDSNMMFN